MRRIATQGATAQTDGMLDVPVCTQVGSRAVDYVAGHDTILKPTVHRSGHAERRSVIFRHRHNRSNECVHRCCSEEGDADERCAGRPQACRWE